MKIGKCDECNRHHVITVKCDTGITDSKGKPVDRWLCEYCIKELNMLFLVIKTAKILDKEYRDAGYSASNFSKVFPITVDGLEIDLLPNGTLIGRLNGISMFLDTHKGFDIRKTGQPAWTVETAESMALTNPNQFTIKGFLDTLGRMKKSIVEMAGRNEIVKYGNFNFSMAMLRYMQKMDENNMKMFAFKCGVCHKSRIFFSDKVNAFDEIECPVCGYKEKPMEKVCFLMTRHLIDTLLKDHIQREYATPEELQENIKDDNDIFYYVLMFETFLNYPWGTKIK
jgi:DNA-directed RNA polymerase subunit RPC12/RpoP